MRQASVITAGISLVAALLFGSASTAFVGANRAAVTATSASGPTTVVASGEDTTGWD